MYLFVLILAVFLAGVLAVPLAPEGDAGVAGAVFLAPAGGDFLEAGFFLAMEFQARRFSRGS